MIREKGFTLIELLAVIVILAIIALIVAPIIMNVITDSKKGAAKDAMYGYVKAVELAGAKQVTPTTDASSGNKFVTKDGNIYQGNRKILDVTIKGTKPKDNTGIVHLSNGNVTYAWLVFDSVTVEYDGKKVGVLEEGSTPNPPVKTYAIGEEVYFDPTGTITDCSSGKEWTPSNTSTTCYKWNVIKDNGNNIEMLLDHNTTATVAWVSKEDYIVAGGTEADFGTYGSNKYGPITLVKQLKIDTDGWSKVEELTSSDNVKNYNFSGATYIINYAGMKARLISGKEIANIVDDTNWSYSKSAVMYCENHSWLYQNLSDFNTGNHLGYWTDTARYSFTNYAWHMRFNGTVYYNVPVNDISKFGLRPVVRVLKSNI